MGEEFIEEKKRGSFVPDLGASLRVLLVLIICLSKYCIIIVGVIFFLNKVR